MPWRRCQGKRLWRERIAPPYLFQDEFYVSDTWPADLTGLVAWWRPETLAVYGANAPLTSWIDSSLNGRTATPYTSVKPVVKKAQQNGLDVVRFAGTTDVLQFTTTGSLSAWTVFMVCGGLNVATNAINYAFGETGAGMIVGGTDATYGFLGSLQDLTRYKLSTVKPTAWGVNCWTPTKIYRDNTETAYSATVGVENRFDFTDVGGRNDIANLGMIGDLGELCVFDNVLSASDQLAIHTYLKRRWNTP